ncbi:hypothetical protein GCM10011351_27040 [Paraliobacillus quinghaiensis]|uniref:DUF3987 domain-containing protein n=1 Tax=Paraliobacillus quinghaiensis TaxID=470815 RepID=A0A917TV87_9BACI|nr:YfjI family protein [Paraliobacillus quinghaiensis]GGM39460.1 hypothetical protein GCM10011351_27040 [Paraliobacillus quinghaiensis]
MNNIDALIQEQHQELQWQEPVPFDEFKLPSFNIEIFPNWLRDYVWGVSETTQTPVDAASMVAISVLSTVASKKFYVQVTNEWSESLNTYAIFALPPGNRKSSVFKLFQEPITIQEKIEKERVVNLVREQKAIIKAKQKRIDSLENEYAKSGDESKLSLIQDLTKEVEEESVLTIPRYITGDITPEQLGVLLSENNEKIALLSAEGGGVFSNMAGRYSGNGKANIDIYLNGHTGDFTPIDRIGREPILLNEPCLTIGLFIQPGVIREVPRVFMERGLMQRFLYSFPKSLVGYRKIDPKSIDKEVKSNYLFYMNKLILFQSNESIKLTFDNDAKIDEQQLRRDIENMLKEDEALSDIKEWGSKLAGQIIRIAGLLHVAEHITSNIIEIPEQINSCTFRKAKSLLTYFIEHAKAAFGVMGTDEGIEDAKYLLKVIKRKDSHLVDYRELQMQTRRRFKKAIHLKKVLNDLQERGYIIPKKEGRKTVYEVNPYVYNSG